MAKGDPETTHTWRYAVRDLASGLSALIAVSVVFSWIGNLWVRDNQIEIQRLELASIRGELEKIKSDRGKLDTIDAVLTERINTCCPAKLHWR